MNPEHHVEHGNNFVAGEYCLLGLRYRPDAAPLKIGDDARIRAGSVIHGDVEIGHHFQCGHHVLIREMTRIGNHVVVGTGSVIDGNVVIGNFVKIESLCYIPTDVTIGSYVFFGPGVTLTNDRYPLKARDRYRPEGPRIEDGVTLGARVTVCPGVTIGADSFVAAGAVVTRDLPPRCFARGIPARPEPLPEHLAERNRALSWPSLDTKRGPR